jgi:hypothetical protein
MTEEKLYLTKEEYAALTAMGAKIGDSLNAGDTMAVMLSNNTIVTFHSNKGYDLAKIEEKQ